MECWPFDPKIASGQPIPPVEHAISVSLPTWKDNLNYEDDKKRLVGALVRGYPRFIVHERIRTLGSLCVQRFGGSPKESCLLFPTQQIADDCREFIERRSSLAGPTIYAQLAHLRLISTENKRALDLHIVIFPLETFPLAKQFWQHAGLGITTRYSNLCLQMSETATYEIPSPISTTKKTRDDVSFLEANCHYDLELDSDVEVKDALRLRIAGFFNTPDSVSAQDSGGSPRSVSSEDVFLFPTGMAAIWNAHQLALSSRSNSKTICYGFLYTDTLKVLQKWGSGCHHLGRGLEPDIQELDHLLETLTAAAELSEPPVSALFTEVPSNPLLQSFNLPRLRSLADKFGFLIVVDDTIATAVNVDILPYADIVTTSLSKFFGGYADVMGGSLVLNPQGRHYEALKTALQASYVDTFFSPDAICMELNSRDFEDRIRTINSSTEYICDFLRERSLAGGRPAGSSVIRDVYYPKYITKELYDSCRRERGGYGGLFTLMFTKETASHSFYDTLSCCKGPSLGTAFTLSCPYTILAHSAELEWAARWGVEEGLVRVSVGVEPLDTLIEWFKLALAAAESAP
ncbi:hypothetical protein PC9H_000235 [Pleurotus ostreatus]|uniref:Cystathionine gamma-synthase n=1 Tax=Pleurotus ostreatus TaxID=5322 RepID=A0A8H7DXM2_PLEOS|nr:uncharacterized protein PC9H_000235 [Pleurotus ostreatus]KAF7439898.1 hypothetical protein PC9H_000235 [Pleurotus ostreatus]KAJ8700908.1 Cystathionine gamma-synthase [Pleurotus ostreatus]